MPRLPINFANSIIYKICCKNPEIKEIYIGSTTNFVKRKTNHKSSCNNQNNNRHNLHVYQFIRANGGWVNWDMIQVEQYSCSSKLELAKRERYYLELLGAKLNTQVPTRTKKEWGEITGYCKKYYEANQETIKSNKSEKIYCECGAVGSNSNRAEHRKTIKHKQYEKLYNFINF